MKRIIALVIAATALATSSAFAHHSFSMFDRTKELDVKGTFIEFEFVSPHVWLWISVPGENGTTTKWGFEGEAPSVLIRKGVKKNSLVPGEQVTVRTNPMRDGRPAGFLVSITKADGTVLHPGNQAPDKVD
jgi:Family of unknown function (DUF6152)